MVAWGVMLGTGLNDGCLGRDGTGLKGVFFWA